MVCLNDDMIAVKAVYIIIEVIKNFKTKKTYNNLLPWAD